MVVLVAVVGVAAFAAGQFAERYSSLGQRRWQLRLPPRHQGSASHPAQPALSHAGGSTPAAGSRQGEWRLAKVSWNGTAAADHPGSPATVRPAADSQQQPAAELTDQQQNAKSAPRPAEAATDAQRQAGPPEGSGEAEKAAADAQHQAHIQPAGGLRQPHAGVAAAAQPAQATAPAPQPVQRQQPAQAPPAGAIAQEDAPAEQQPPLDVVGEASSGVNHTALLL